MKANGKTCVVARARRMSIQDSHSIVGIEDQNIHHPDTYTIWNGTTLAGGFIQSITARKDENNQIGRGIVWLTNNIEMIEEKNNK